MKDLDFEIEGLDEVRKLITDSLPSKIKTKLMKQAMNAAGNPPLKAVRKNMPVRSGTSKKAAAKKMKSYKDGGNTIVLIGVKTGATGNYRGDMVRPANIIHFIEEGTQPHDIKIKQGPMAGATVKHSGAKAKWVLREAQRSTKNQSIDAAKKKLAVSIPKEAVKLAKGKIKP